MKQGAEQGGRDPRATFTATIQPGALPFYERVAQSMQSSGIGVSVGSPEMWTDGKIRVLLRASASRDLSTLRTVAQEIEGITVLLRKGPATPEEIDRAIGKRLEALFPSPQEAGTEQ